MIHTRAPDFAKVAGRGGPDSDGLVVEPVPELGCILSSPALPRASSAQLSGTARFAAQSVVAFRRTDLVVSDRGALTRGGGARPDLTKSWRLAHLFWAEPGRDG